MTRACKGMKRGGGKESVCTRCHYVKRARKSWGRRVHVMSKKVSAKKRTSVVKEETAGKVGLAQPSRPRTWAITWFTSAFFSTGSATPYRSSSASRTRFFVT